MNTKEKIAKRVAQEIQDGDVVNLGIGLPELVADHIPEDFDVWFQGDNGIIARQRTASAEEEDEDIIDAGNNHIVVKPGASYFDSAMAFGISRGGHLDVAVLGALQVDGHGSVAGHYIPGKLVAGMGGAMDIATGAKKLIIASTFAKRDGTCVLVDELSYPVTVVSRADLIVTDWCVVRVTERGFVLEEIAEGHTIEEIRRMTSAKLTVSEALRTMPQ